MPQGEQTETAETTTTNPVVEEATPSESAPAAAPVRDFSSWRKASWWTSVPKEDQAWFDKYHEDIRGKADIRSMLDKLAEDEADPTKAEDYVKLQGELQQIRAELGGLQAALGAKDEEVNRYKTEAESWRTQYQDVSVEAREQRIAHKYPDIYADFKDRGEQVPEAERYQGAFVDFVRLLDAIPSDLPPDKYAEQEERAAIMARAAQKGKPRDVPKSTEAMGSRTSGRNTGNSTKMSYAEKIESLSRRT